MAQPPPLHPILLRHFENEEIALTEIDAEIASLQQVIRAIHAFRNTFTPVYRLPPEVLTRIFLFFHGLHISKDETYHTTSDAIKWTVVTHVSQHWRNVALGSPNLWSHISSFYPMRIREEWLTRSKNAPLCLHLHEPSVEDFVFIGASLTRMQELRLTLPWTSWTHLSSNLLSPAPLLDTLSIEGMMDLLEPPATYSQNIFNGTAPRLTCLKLRRYPIPIDISPFTQLTVLAIESSGKRISPSDLLASLRSLVALKSLSLSAALHTDAIPIPSDVDIVRLPSLQSLQLREKFVDTAMDIISHLSFPATTALELEGYWRQGIDSTDSVIAVFSDILSAYKQASQTMTPSVFVDSLTFGSSQTVQTFHVNHSHGPPCNQPGCVSNLLELTLFGLIRHNILHILDTPEVHNFFSSLPLSTLSWFSTNCDIATGIWTKVFGCLPNLRYISASGDHAFNLITAMFKDFKKKSPAAQKTKKSSGKGKGKRESGSRDEVGNQQTTEQVASTYTSQVVEWIPIFPALETLRLEEMGFPDHRADAITALQARKQVGKTLQLLEIEGCRNIDRDFYNALKAVVAQVEWDWHAEEYSEGEYDEPEPSD